VSSLAFSTSAQGLTPNSPLLSQTGRIVNRFSRDIEVIDSSLTQSLRVVLNYFFALIGALVVVTFITPAFFIPAVFLALAYWRLSVRYIRR
jgi:ABC-type multidrug transport system fused ATPase/permease subunit